MDVETSGTNPFMHDVIEVGIVLLDEGLSVIEEREFSLPFDVREASPEALEVNGWGQRPFAPEVDFDTAKKWLYEMFGPYKTTAMIGMHAKFDAGFLEALLARRCGDIDNPWGKHVYDLPSLAAGRWGILPPLRSHDMVKLLELDHGGKVWEAGSDRHTALGDARLNAAILRGLKLRPSWSQG